MRDRLRNSLRVGGQIVVESFSDPASLPGRPATSIDPDDPLSAFRKGFRVVHFQDVLAQPDWGPPSKRRVVRLVAERVQ